MNKLTLLGLVVLLCASCSSTPKTEPDDIGVKPTLADAKSPMGIYTRGQDATSNGKYREALEYFTRLRQEFPKDKTMPQALLGSGYAHYKLGNNDATVEASNAFIQTYEKHSLVDYAHYLRGLARYNEGIEQLQNEHLSGNARTSLARKSFESFSGLVRRFPNSKYNQDSRIRMEVLHSKLAEHELKLAKDALAIDKYKEAIARADYIIKHYSRSESAPEAYSVMINAFTAQGELVKAYDVRKALNHKYPDHRHTNRKRAKGGDITRITPLNQKLQQTVKSTPIATVPITLPGKPDAANQLLTRRIPNTLTDESQFSSADQVPVENRTHKKPRFIEANVAKPNSLPTDSAKPPKWELLAADLDASRSPLLDNSTIDGKPTYKPDMVAANVAAPDSLPTDSAKLPKRKPLAADFDASQSHLLDNSTVAGKRAYKPDTVAANVADPNDLPISSSSTGIKREAWYMSQPSNSFTLQLLSTSKESALERYIHRHKIEDGAGYFYTNNSGNDLLTLTYGVYNSNGEALSAMEQLSSALRKSNPWVRPMSDIQSKLKGF